MPTVGQAITTHTDKVRRLIRRRPVAIAASEIRTRLDVVANTRRHSLYDAVANVLAILRVVLGLLTVDQCNSIDVVILMVGVLITSHYQVFLCFFQPDGAQRLGALTRYIDISHILIRATSRLRRYLILPRCCANAYWIAQLAL